MSHRSVWLTLFALTFAACGSDTNGPDDGPLPSDLTLALQPFVTSGLVDPVFLAQPLNDGRIFVVEKEGRIRVVRNGALQTAPFLDIRSRVSSVGERGLLSVAFHPQYATNRFFYVYFTGLNGEITIERHTTSADPEVASSNFPPVIFIFSHPETNHNGGLVTFGPDGMLWTAFGDGGGAGDPNGNAQNLSTLLGSMLRVNVDGGNPYSIPPDNPNINQPGRRNEVWAKGLRNPWRFSIDAPSGILYIADVGQNSREEINARPYTAAGLNYGWNIMEGNDCYPPGMSGCSQTGLTLPLVDYGRAGGACSVTGGYVYRGSAIDGLQGHYLYSDYCARWIRSFRYSNGAAVDTKDWQIVAPGNVSSFGVDFAGEIYVIAGSGIYRIVEGS
jgi:glucose/arabinose dehydrogenase